MNHLNLYQQKIRQVQYAILDKLKEVSDPSLPIIRVSSNAFHFMFYTNSASHHIRDLQLDDVMYQVISYPSWNMTGHSVTRPTYDYIEPIDMGLTLPDIEPEHYERALIEIVMREVRKLTVDKVWEFEEIHFVMHRKHSTFHREAISLQPLLVCAMNEYLGNGFHCAESTGKGVPALFEKIRQEECLYYSVNEGTLEGRTLPFALFRILVAKEILRLTPNSSIERKTLKKDTR